MRNRAMSLAALLLTLCAAQGDAQIPPRFTVEDMLAVRTLAAGQPVAVSSTGRWIAYVLTDKDVEWNVQEGRPTGHVYVQTLGAGQVGEPRALSSGAAHSFLQVWS